MQCKFIHDVDVDVSTMDAESKKLVDWRPEKRRDNGKPRLMPYFPAGTVYEHPNAAFFVRHGMATPEDDECKAAVSDMSDADIANAQRAYNLARAGITDEADVALADAGVIAGYTKNADGQLTYIPGPNYAAWKKRQDDAAAKKEIAANSKVPI